MYLNDIFTVTANLTGLPALALPAAIDAQGLPLGLQVIGKALDEESVFAVSAGAGEGGELPRQAGEVVGVS